MNNKEGNILIVAKRSKLDLRSQAMSCVPTWFVRMVVFKGSKSPTENQIDFNLHLELSHSMRASYQYMADI